MKKLLKRVQVNDIWTDDFSKSEKWYLKSRKANLMVHDDIRLVEGTVIVTFIKQTRNESNESWIGEDETSC